VPPRGLDEASTSLSLSSGNGPVGTGIPVGPGGPGGRQWKGRGGECPSAKAGSKPNIPRAGCEFVDRVM
jgi:hypothetical protein